MKLTLGIIAAVSLFTLSVSADCEATYNSTLASVEANKASVLQIVTKTAEANQDCVCEIVKAAIIASEADKELVGQIVDKAIVASPDNMRLISQCAIAIAPDAAQEVQKVLAKFTPQSGASYSAKGYSPKGGPKDVIGPDPRGPVTGPAGFNPLDGPPVVAPVPGFASDPFIPFEEVSDPTCV